MSQSLPLPQDIEIDVTLSQIFNSIVPTGPDDALSGFLYKKEADDGLFWKTLNSGEINLITSSINSYGTSLSILGGTTIIALSNTKAGSNALLTSGAAANTGANTAFGQSALRQVPDLSAVAGFTAFGYQAGSSVTTGSDSIFVGRQTGRFTTSAVRDVFIGSLVASNTLAVSGGNNTLIGYNIAGTAAFTGAGNVMTGSGIATTALGANNNTYSGYQCAASNTSGSNNTISGYSAASALTTASTCTAFGQDAMNANISADGLSCFGAGALLLATGLGNAAFGFQAGATIISGTNNLVLGNSADVSTATDTNCIVVGNSTKSVNSAEIRIGFDTSANSVQTRAFIDGIRGRTTGQADAVPILVDSKGQLGTVSSSSRYKHNINDISDVVINSVYDMRPVSFIYNEDSSDTITYGLIAEEVQKIRPDIVVYSRKNDGSIIYDKEGNPQVETVQYHLILPMLIGCIKQLKEEIETLKLQI